MTKMGINVKFPSKIHSFEEIFVHENPRKVYYKFTKCHFQCGRKFRSDAGDEGDALPRGQGRVETSRHLPQENAIKSCFTFTSLKTC